MAQNNYSNRSEVDKLIADPNRFIKSFTDQGVNSTGDFLQNQPEHLSSLDCSYDCANPEYGAEQQQQPWPKVKITVSNQPVSSYRHRSDGEINNFNSQGSTKAVGSLLKGRNDNGQGEFIKIALELTDGYQREFDVDGELIVLLVDTNGTIFGEPPLKVHPWNLKGEHCSTAGVYRQKIKLRKSETSIPVLFNKIGIVKCKNCDVLNSVDQKARMLNELFKSSEDSQCNSRNLRRMFHNPNDESSGPLSVDPLKEVQQSVRLLFAFVPDDSQMVLNSYAISEPILCQLGSDGGKSFGVKAFNPVCVYLKRDLQYPMTSDIWVQLEADIKKKSETISAQLLVPCTSAATANPLSVEVSIPVEVQRNLLKLQLTKLEVQDTIANLPEEQFMAKLCLTKESNSSGRLTSSVDVRFIYLNQLKTPSLHNRAKRPRQD
ncbi:hypothetical protein BOX15_Mlig027372g2 [Macrostomum lignano]|uniref:RHD domain-containing protein n=1 Tax=Macrostomum lignano TaxID=282301 RepID=A0A267G7I1_9PLAT|nr:hypothetical protein BOX15_Mlig027372g2 [Macrostomum lignano]